MDILVIYNSELKKWLHNSKISKIQLKRSLHLNLNPFTPHFIQNSLHRVSLSARALGFSPPIISSNLHTYTEFGTTMPFMSEAASAIKSRFGFHDHNPDPIPSIRSTPDLLKTASKENILQSSAIRSIAERDDQSFEIREDPSFWKDHNVQVIIRIRPLSNSELSLQGSSKCVRQDSCQTVTWTGHPESRFTFDIVADENVSQEMLFKVAGVPMVENCIGGYNSCMFAYGQTGSGKTHTMLGDIEGGTRRHSVNCGMTPRVFEYLFSRIQKEREARREEKIRYTCKCSFLEIYNEQILDLLDPSSMNLQIREDTKKGVYVDNLSEVEVTSARDVIQQLVQGSANRKVAATNMNRASSRSHSVFTCIIESKWESQGVTHHRFARLNLVDLAGSERQKSSGAEGERLKEATNINKSLSTLGLVIMNLINISNGKSQHVPYRDSKLTFLLQDSLGGNSKTTIIANISPSSCCSLETLSTLKFAQRAKFIKNHATVNEDASGDVLAMRMQIQQLKKEVSRLQNMVNGVPEDHESEAGTVSFPGSPGTFKWEGLHGSFTPFTSDKRGVAQKKEYEAALVGAFRREKDKDIALQSLTAENEAAMKLAKQREDEIQVLKMRLRFRESGIKRLEAVASGKISAETHLLKEKEEHLKEMEVLRSQVDRNQDVTRFAMENLRLKEEIRRLKLSHEDGQLERMNEQIMILQNKLLEALDWKLMHESDPSTFQKGVSELAMDAQNDSSLLGSSSKEQVSPWRTAVNEENEFLRMQAIQNQSEMGTLRKKLDICIEEKDKLERRVHDLEAELEAERSLKAAMKEDIQKLQLELPPLTSDQPTIALNDQTELKTMVDAIAAASQREAKAHEIAFVLSKENDELRMKLKILIEDNNKLIEIYERAVSDNLNNKPTGGAQNSQEENAKGQNSHFTGFAEERELQRKKEVDLESQLAEMHEENEKLLGLYETAMQERDEFKRMLSSGKQTHVEETGKLNFSESLVEVDDRESVKFVESSIFGKEDIKGDEANVLLEESLFEVNVQDDNDYSLCSGSPRTNDYLDIDELPNFVDARSVIEGDFAGPDVQDNDQTVELDVLGCSDMDIESKSSDVIKASKDLNSVRLKLDKAQEMILHSAQNITLFGSLERAIIEIEDISREIETINDNIRVKNQEYTSSKLICLEMLEKSALVDKKLTALKVSVSSFSTSVGYFEKREIQARERLSALLSQLNGKKEELGHLEAQKEEISEAQKQIQLSKVELKNNITQLKETIEEENRRQENEKVLIAIDNVDKAWHLASKATELLKSEEEKTKLQFEMKQALDKLGVMRKEAEDLNMKFKKMESKIELVQIEIHNGLKMEEEMSHKLQNIVNERQLVWELKENGLAEFGNLIIEYQQYLLESELKEEEIKILAEELEVELRRSEELEIARSAVTERKARLLEETMSRSCFLSDTVEEGLQNVRLSFMELKSLLVDDC